MLKKAFGRSENCKERGKLKHGEVRRRKRGLNGISDRLRPFLWWRVQTLGSQQVRLSPSSRHQLGQERSNISDWASPFCSRIVP